MSTADSQRIRVLHLGSATGLYGAERWILALAKHLPQGRVESWVAAIKDSPALDAPLCRHAAQLGLRTQVFESHGKLSLSAIGQLRRFIRDHHIDIVHTHGYKTDIIGWLAARATSCKTVATPHGWGATAGVKLRLYEALDRLVFFFVDAIAPLSAELYAGLRRLPRFRRRLHLIPNGVDLSEVDSAGPPPAPLPAWRADGSIIIGYIGRLDRGKRLDTLIRAFHRLGITPKRLCIVGEGPERLRLERLAAELGDSERVVFFGFREDRLQLLRGFDLFVLPSEHEGIPRCLMEAMALGLGVIASDIPGCRDLVENGVTGLLFPAGNDDELLRQITTMLDNPHLRAELARMGCRRVRRTYSAEAMTAGYVALYSSLVENNSRREPVEETP